LVQPYRDGSPTLREGSLVEDAIRVRAEEHAWPIAAINVRTQHVHVVVHADELVERVMTVFKAAATRALRESGLRSSEARVWSRHGSTRYLGSDRAVEDAVRYVLEGQDTPKNPS
jgi:REP element-mobilizing transposase RayT